MAVPGHQVQGTRKSWASVMRDWGHRSWTKMVFVCGDYSYGAACEMAGIDEWDEYITGIAAPRKSELLQLG
jgi:hypothetical protein